MTCWREFSALVALLLAAGCHHTEADPRILKQEKIAAATPDIATPWELVEQHQASGAVIDEDLLALIRKHYPDTGVGRRGEGKPLVFIKCRGAGSICVDGKALHVIELNRAIWGMLAPRGQPEVLVVDDSGKVVLRRRGAFDAYIDGTVLRLDHCDVGIDLASNEQLQQVAEVHWQDAECTIGAWYERIDAAMPLLYEPDASSQLIIALKPEWNARLVRVECDGNNLSLTQFANRFQGASAKVRRPVIGDMHPGPAESDEFNSLEWPWTGEVCVTLTNRDGTCSEAVFHIEGAKPCS